MEKKQKKKYNKPKVTKIKLDAECAVLGFCKTSPGVGPGKPNCGVSGIACSSNGS